MNQAKMKHAFGILGLVFGVLAIGVAIFQENLREVVAPPPVIVEEDRSFKELAIGVGKKMLAEKLDGVEAPSPKSEETGWFSGLDEKYDSVALIYAFLGFIAIVLGVVSWARRDHVRISGGAIALGLMAVAWQYVLVGIGIAIIIFILANISA